MRRSIERTPIIGQVYGYLLQHRFQTNGYSHFWGVYKTFEEARQAAPNTKKVGYDDPELAQEYQQMLTQDNWENSGRVVAVHDYPVIFWLKSIFEQGNSHTVFDFGGNVGIHFYSYAKYLMYPENLRWTICEVPEIAKVGKQIAEQRGIDNLDYTHELKDVEGKDIFIASGSMQYIEDISHILSVSEKPRHLLINRTPLYNGNQFVTLQNGGKVFYPQYVFNKTAFIDGLERIGYKLVDIWENQGDTCIIPFHPDRSVDRYYGLYFKLGS
jgi:putative methyltransferase (TIGR04325 family)